MHFNRLKKPSPRMTVPNFIPYDRPLHKELINTFVVGVSNVYLSGEIQT